MIPTSQAYKDMMLGLEMASRIVITIEGNGEPVTLTDKDIVKGSVSVNWRASNNKELGFGTCYASSFSFTSFTQVDIEIEGGYLKITPTLYFAVDGGEQEVPLGVFYCSEPTVFVKTTAYECYDAMLFFDKPIASRLSGTAYNILAYFASECGVPFGSTSQEVSRMPNSSQTLVIDPSDVSTMRDALGLISRVLGAYCIIGRDGKLYVRQFHITSDMVLERQRRSKTSFSGYQTIFAGVQCRFRAEQNFYPYRLVERDYGIIMDLGDIPIIEDDERAKRAILERIWLYLKDVQYYPCEIEMVGDPSIEAGDMLTTKNREGYDRNILLTSVTYNWRQISSILSEGANPQIKAVSTAEKRTQNQQEQAQKWSQVVTTTFVNANPLTIGDSTRTELTDLRFTTEKNLTAIFGAEIPVYSDGDGIVVLEYEDNGVVGDTVRARVHEGYNLITLVNHLYYEANSIVNLKVRGSSEAIGSGTAPTVAVDADSIRSYIFAQGIITEAPWDGIIIISEHVDYVRTQMVLRGLSETVVLTSQNPAERVLSEVVDDVQTQMQMQSVSDRMTLTLEYGDQILRMGQGHRAGMGRIYVRW